MGTRRRSVGIFLSAALAALIVADATGCDSPARRAAGYYSQAQAGRGAAAAAMAADWRANKILLDDCLDLAFDRVDNVGDTASLVFAGTVLDFAQLIEKELPQSGEMELFWSRLGGLAAASGQKASDAGDIKLARSLVLAGPMRWQSEAYWRLHPNHDALAAYVLFMSGEGAEAVRRLRSRADLEPVQQKALEDIQTGMRQAPPQ
jgi:hypothetical protein